MSTVAMIIFCLGMCRGIETSVYFWYRKWGLRYRRLALVDASVLKIVSFTLTVQQEGFFFEQEIGSRRILRQAKREQRVETVGSRLDGARHAEIIQ